MNFIGNFSKARQLGAFRKNLTNAIIDRKVHTPRRALMYVPGDDKRKLRKAIQLEADCIALDLEDGVAMNKKEKARQTVRAFFESGSHEPVDANIDHRKAEWCVRINSVRSGFCDEDLAMVLGGAKKPSTILLPKTDSKDDFKFFASAVDKFLANDHDHRLNLIFYAESAKSIMRLPELCDYAMELSKSSKFVPVGIVFGSDDLIATLGGRRTEDSREILYARQRIVLIAKAFELQAIDMVYIDYKNLEGLKKQSLEGARLGYTGKQVIHPDQLAIVQKAFIPPPEAVEWANALLDAWEQHQKEGVGAFTFRNSMIDAPTMKQAQNIVKIMKSIQ